MKQLLAIEYTKLKKLNSLKVLLFCYIVVVPLLVLATDYIYNLEPAIRLIVGDAAFFQFPLVWKVTALSASFVNILLCVSIVIITCNEIHFKTMRQNVIDGLSKGQVIFSKFLIVVIFSLFVTFYTFFVGFIFGAINGGMDHVFEGIDLIFRYFLQTLGYFSFAFLFALLLKKPALSIVLFIVYFPIEWILKFFIGHEVHQFLPLKSFADLTPLPFEGMFTQNVAKQKGIELWYMSVEMHYVLAVVYIALFFGISYFILRRRDL